MITVEKVQYDMLTDLVTAELVWEHRRVPSMQEVLPRVSSYLPQPGSPMPVPLDNPAECYQRLWWNYLFLERAWSVVAPTWERYTLWLENALRIATIKLRHLERKVRVFSERDPEVVYTFYDSFGNSQFVQSTNLLLDTAKGELRLPLQDTVQLDSFNRPSIASRVVEFVGSLFGSRPARSMPVSRRVAMRSGVEVNREVNLQSRNPVLLNGLRISMVGMAVVSVHAKVGADWKLLFRSALSGESDVDFADTVTDSVRVVAEGNGYIRSVSPYRRAYSSEGVFVSTPFQFRADAHGRQPVVVRLRLDHDQPQNTTVQSYVRFVYADGSFTEWQEARGDIPVPISAQQVNLGEHWQFIESENVYRNLQAMDSPYGVLLVGRNQWQVYRATMDDSAISRVTSRQSLPAEWYYALSMAFSGFLRYMMTTAEVDSMGNITSVYAPTDADQDDLLFCVSERARSYYISMQRLESGYIYLLKGWFHSDTSGKMSVGLGSAYDLVGATSILALNGKPVLALNPGSRSVSAQVSFGLGWNLVEWYIAVAAEQTQGMALSLGQAEVHAYRERFLPCSPHELRYDPSRSASHYSWFSTSSGHYVELPLPMKRFLIGDVQSRLANVVLIRDDFGSRVSAVQVMLRLASTTNSKTPVVRSYRLEVLARA